MSIRQSIAGTEQFHSQTDMDRSPRLVIQILAPMSQAGSGGITGWRIKCYCKLHKLWDRQPKSFWPNLFGLADWPCLITFTVPQDTWNMHQVDDGAKMAAIQLHARGAEGDNIPEICHITGMLCTSFYQALQKYEEEGTVHIPNSKKCGCPWEHTRADIMYLKSLVMQTPMYYLQDLQKQLSQNQFLDLSESMIHQIFEREHFCHKKAEKRAAEWDEEEVAHFVYNISQYKIAQLSCLDVSAKDERMYFKLYGRAPKGMPVEVEAPFMCGNQYTLLPAMDVNGIYAAKVVLGSMDQDLFMDFLEYDVVSADCIILPLC